MSSFDELSKGYFTNTEECKSILRLFPNGQSAILKLKLKELREKRSRG
jgi:hypothetical protein